MNTNPHNQIDANAQEIKRLKAALRHKAREREMEILFLRQALKAREIQASLGDAPKGLWKGLDHNHLCEHCNETWRCDCDEGDYVVTQHGCDAQLAATRRLAIALSMPSPWDAPYLSRQAKPRKPRGAPQRDALQAQIVANEAEIRKLRSELRT